MPIIKQFLYQTDKSSHRRCSLKKLFVKILQFWQESPELNYLLGLGWNIKKRLQYRSFPVNIAKFLFNTCFEEHLRPAASENDNKKRFLGKATGHNDQNMINMTGQRPKIGGIWPLTGPYLQRCPAKCHLITGCEVFLYKFAHFDWK